MEQNQEQSDKRRESRMKLLKSVFGFDHFRPFQEEIIASICDGRDVFAVMPTGGGKSLCYQFPAYILPGVCVVISPLLSLMKDQVDSACELGVRAATINSTTSGSGFYAITDALERGEIDLLYISPERLCNQGFLERIARLPISFFAIDEAHCISEWGHQFRPSYLELGQISELFPGVPIAAFTATATDRVGADIMSRLKLRNPLQIRASFNRPNLDYRVIYKEDLNRQLLQFLKTAGGEPGIIYRGTRKKVEETAQMLARKGYLARPYHAGMTNSERTAVQEDFSRDRVQIIVATVAFGMGIDKPNVRFVVHADLPKNIEGYYQETGRAGRDGSPSRCLLLFGYQDIVLQQSFIGKYEDPSVREMTRRQLNDMIRFAESDECRRKALLRYFGEEYLGGNCGHCDFCNDMIKRVDATTDAQKALSAMFRTGNRFGIGYLVDILTGTNNSKVQMFRHNQLSTFGVGRNRSKNYWRTLLNALVCRGAAAMRPDFEFPVPYVTEEGVRILKGQEAFEMIDLPTAIKEPKFQRVAAVPKKERGLELTPEERDLYEALRNRRREVAIDRNVPPYIIFNDSTLIEMAQIKPLTLDDMLKISGVGEKKLQAYGQDFLDLIEEHLANAPDLDGFDSLDPDEGGDA